MERYTRQEEGRTLRRACLMALLAALIVLNAADAIMLLCHASADTARTASVRCFVAVSALNVPALVGGILCVLNGYGGRAASCYRALLLMTAAAGVPAAIWLADQGIRFGEVIVIAGIVILLALTLWKNPGSRTAWILFCFLLATDLIFGFTFGYRQSMGVYGFISILTRLTIDGTIGLAVRGGDEDRRARRDASS